MIIEFKIFESDDNYIIGAKLGDTIVFNYDISSVVSSSDTEYFFKGEKYEIMKIYNVDDKIPKKEITDIDEFLIVSKNGEEITTPVRAHFFILELYYISNKYNL